MIPWFGPWGLRGFNEWVDHQGRGFWFILQDLRGASWPRLFPNVGQPDPSPPANPHHIDDFSIRDDIFISFFRANPLALDLRLEDQGQGGLDLRVRQESDGSVAFQLETSLTLVFHGTEPHSPGPEPRIHGLAMDEPLTGLIRFLVEAPGQGLPRFRALQRLETLDWSPGTTAIGDVVAASAALNLVREPGLAAGWYVPVNKAWIGFLSELFSVGHSRGPLVVPWDNSLASLCLAEAWPDAAWANLAAVFEAQDPEGRLPQIRLDRLTTNRSNPPVWFLVADWLDHRHPDRARLKALVPALAASYRWFRAHRRHDPEGPLGGTYAWGSEEGPGATLGQTRGKEGAKMESGLDDSPLWDPMEIGPDGILLDHACIDLSCLMYRNHEILTSWARDPDLSPLLPQEMVALLEEDQALHAKGLASFFPHPGPDAPLEQRIPNSWTLVAGQRVAVDEITPLSFYPLLCSDLPEAAVAVLDDLLGSDHFATEDPALRLPSLSRRSPRWNGDGDYWRGRIWPPMVWLVARGLERWLPERHREVAEGARQVLTREWERHGHAHENYSGETGAGEPRPGTYARSCPLYSWAGLLGLCLREGTSVQDGPDRLPGPEFHSGIPTPGIGIGGQEDLGNGKAPG